MLRGVPPPQPKRDTVRVEPDFEQFVASWLDGSPDGSDLERIAGRSRLVPGITKVEVREDRVTATVVAEVTAEQIARWLSLEDVYLVSGDAHLAAWSILVKVGDLDDPYGVRIHCVRPVVGPWQLRMQVEQPRLPLPGISSGASPAYPVEGSNVFVTEVTFIPRPEEGLTDSRGPG